MMFGLFHRRMNSHLQYNLVITVQQIELDQKAEWLRGVRQVPSPNQDERPEGAAIDLLVIHGISLPPGHFGGNHIDALFTNSLDPDLHPYFREITGRQVSAHVLINRAGDITQYVPFNRRAWHAGVSTFQGRTCCNDFSIGIELEGCDDQPYTGNQYAALAGLSRVLCGQWTEITQDRIVGHCHIAPDRKTDPGPSFDWQYYFKLLGCDSS